MSVSICTSIIKHIICLTLILLSFGTIGQLAFDEAVANMSIQHDPVVLKQGDARAVILGEFQGRVMVTSADGDKGSTFGWINHDYLSKPNTLNRPSAGGASRLWFGPETGPYSVFFKPGEQRINKNIYIADAVTVKPFALDAKTDSTATFKQDITIENNYGFKFEANIERKIELFSTAQISTLLATPIDKSLKVVGFGADTKMTNIGKVDWNKDTGILSIWELGTFEPSDNAVIFMPIKGELEEVISYFTPTLDTHTKIKNQVVYYHANANYMNKIGIPAANTKPLIGYYNSDKNLLSVFQFQINEDDSLYNNSVWYEENYLPYNGDIINIFNDGLTEGQGPNGRFFEVETSSSARPLQVNESHQHFQNTYHFQGDEADLTKLTLALFDLSLDEIKAVFAVAHE